MLNDSDAEALIRLGVGDEHVLKNVRAARITDDVREIANESGMKFTVQQDLLNVTIQRVA